MLPRAGKEFLVRIRLSWRTLFQGRYLLLTNTLSGGVITVLGDSLQQSWESHKDPGRVQDWRRTGRMFVMSCSMGPLHHYWYHWLDKVFVGTALNTVGKKLILDQLIPSPTLGVWYFLGMGVMEGRTLSEGWEEFKDKFWEYYKADCCVWPAAQMINFFFLSPKFRVLYINIVALGWDTYMSYLKHRDGSHHTEIVLVQKEALPPSKPLEEKA
ncbi:mpv17-like protein 2 [Micropterus salmoides]|uniref:mpv17-like protein 2 n=1 Tax=Micropterus salmoides TaxID=27706 RepID=UPI0018EDFE75|nr:mpv17-like protein 2 [Micropterus salmoides]